MQKFSFPDCLLLPGNIDLTFWYMNLSWHDTDQVWLLLRLTRLHSRYFLLFKFSFPHFTLSSCKILTSNLGYEFVLTYYRKCFTLLSLHVCFLQLCINLLGPVGDMYCFSNTHSMLVLICLICWTMNFVDFVDMYIVYILKEWFSWWLEEEGIWGLNPGLTTSIIWDFVSPASKLQYDGKFVKAP